MSIKIIMPTMPSERSQTKRKNIYCIVPFIYNSRKRKLIYNGRRQISDCRGMGYGDGEVEGGMLKG